MSGIGCTSGKVCVLVVKNKTIVAHKQVTISNDHGSSEGAQGEGDCQNEAPQIGSKDLEQEENNYLSRLFLSR